MTLRPALHLVAVAAVTSFLVGYAAPPTEGGEWSTAADRLPSCPVGSGQPDPAASAAPAELPAVDHPAACRARPTGIEPAGSGQLPVPRPGYHHLGATTVDGWSGVLGRLTVRDPQLAAGSFDFVATRFMAKHQLAGGGIGWLEVGWVETGWSGGGAQRIYTFDSHARSWTFFDEYRIGDGDQIWVYLHSDPEAGRVVWRAWLWWAGRWHLLSAPQLPLPDRAVLEQYVEVHQDRPGSPIPVPPIQVDRVQVRDRPGAPLLPWRADRVSTVAPVVATDYCLTWADRYDSWSAGDCAATVQG